MKRFCKFSVRGSLPAVIVLATLSALGLYMTAYKLEIVRDVRFVGHADAAAYAEMGRSLVAGRGFQIRHVSTFFIPYNPDIERHEDHWPPFMGMAIAPAFRMWGVDSWSAKFPAILFGSVGLPIAVALLGMAFSGKAYVGLICGLIMMSRLDLFTASLTTLCDVAIAMLLAFFLAAVLGARKRPWLHLAGGCAAALAYYAKGSMLVLIPLYPLIALTACGRKALAQKWTYAGMLVASLCILPWLLTNWAHYGHPLHSTQNFVSGYIGFGSWERNFYYPYWGENLPKTSDRWREHGERYWEVTARNAEAFTRWALLGPGTGEEEWYRFGRPGAWMHQRLAPENSRVRQQRSGQENYGTRWGPVTEWEDPLWAMTGIGAVLFLAALLIATPVIAVKSFITEVIGLFVDKPGNNQPRSSADNGREESAALPVMAIGPALAILLVMAAHWAFIVFLWEIRSRFAFVFLPATTVLAVTGAARILESIPALTAGMATSVSNREKTPPAQMTDGRLQKWRWIPVFLLCITAFAAIMFNTERLKKYHQDNVNVNTFPYSDRSIYPQLGDWLHVNEPDATIMSRNPWQLRFHAPDSLKAVGLPHAPPEKILGIGRYYGITHYLNDRRRPGMEKYTRSGQPHPAFERVEGAPGPLFKIHWDELRPEKDYKVP